MAKKDWVWMPHAGHLIVSQDCRFHLNTYLGNGYLVSTVGEWWPDRRVREIHAQMHDPKWFAANKNRLGDDFDHAYMKRFGYEDIGLDRRYETMVFKAKRDLTAPVDWRCCPWKQLNGMDVDSDGYNTATDAYQGHLEMCEKWKLKRGGTV